MSHDCIFRYTPLPEQPGFYLVQCRCHEDRWTTRRTDDPPYHCPETGTPDRLKEYL